MGVEKYMLVDVSEGNVTHSVFIRGAVGGLGTGGRTQARLRVCRWEELLEELLLGQRRDRWGELVGDHLKRRGLV